MSTLQKWLRSPNIERLVRKNDTAGLIRALDTPDEKISRKARQALISLGDSAVQPLIDELDHPNNRLRKAVVDVLGQIGAQEAVGPLVNVVNEEIQEPQLAAIVALGRIGSSKAAKPLVDRLVQIVEKTNWEKANAAYDPQRATTAVRALVEIKLSLLNLGEKAIEPISRQLLNENRLVRYHLGRALGLFGIEGVRHLLFLLNDKDYKVRLAAAETLDQIYWEPLSTQDQITYWVAKQDWVRCAETGRAAISTLLGFLGDSNPAISTSVAQTLHKIGWNPEKNTTGARYWINLRQWESLTLIGPAAAPVLVEFIKNIIETVESQSERQKEIPEATDILVKIGEPAIPDILRGLQSDHALMRRTMAETLVSIREPSIEPLLGMRNTEQDTVREQVVWALGKLGLINRSNAVRVISGISQSLNDPASSVCRMAAEYVGEIGARYEELAFPAVPVLIAMLKDKVAAVNRQAVVSLGMVGDPRAVDPLIETLFSQDASLRTLSATALGRIGSRRAVDPLIEALKNPEYGIQSTAATVLGILGDPKAVDPLIEALKSRLADLRKEAATALGKINQPRAASALIPLLYDANASVKLAAIQALGRLHSAEALPQLVDILKSTQPGIQDAAAEAVMRIGGTQAAERLVYFLIHYNDTLVWDPFRPDFNAEALENGKKTLDKVRLCLMSIGEESLEPLIAALGYSDVHVRQLISEVLEKIGFPAVQKLIATLVHSDRHMRLAAAEELDKLGWKPGSDRMRTAYWIAKQEWEHCVELGPAAAEQLTYALQYPDEPIRLRVVDCLERIGWKPSQDTIGARYWIIRRKWDECTRIGKPAIEPLVKTFASILELLRREPDNPQLKADRDGVARALAAIGEPSIDPLLELLTQGIEVTGVPVIQILCQIGEPAVLPLISGLTNPSATIRMLAARSLGKIRAKQAVETLIKLLEDADDRVCCEAVIALGNIGDRRAVPALILRLSDLKDEIRRESAVALGKIGDYRAQQPLILALQDSNTEVKIAAAEALSKFGDDQATSALINALRREREEVQKPAAEALVAIGGSLCIEMLIDLLIGITDSTNWNPASLNYDLQSTISAGYIQVKTRWALAELAPASIQPLITALKGKSDQVRFHLHLTLGMIGDRAILALVNLLDNQDMEWRLLAADALDEIGWKPGRDRHAAAYWATRRNWDRCAEIGEPAIPVLLRALCENDDYERMVAAEHLVKTGWKPEKDKEGAQYWIARKEWRKLENLKGTAVPSLITALADFIDQTNKGTINSRQGNQVIEDIKNTLAKIGRPAVDDLVKTLLKGSNDLRPHISTILVKIGTPAVAPLCDLMKEKNPVLRMTTAAIWGEIKTEESVQPLIDCLDDPEDLVREQAVLGLAKTGAGLHESRMRVSLIETLVQTLQDPSSRVQKAAQKALLELDWQGTDQE